jgi:hypothetical protein
MSSQEFESWFAELEGQSTVEIERLLRDRTAVRFLIAWSMFETVCFAGFMKAREIQPFAERLTQAPAFDISGIRETFLHFHERYQNRTFYKRLLYNDKNDRFQALLAKPLAQLTAEETVFVVAFVVYRFRNNIFHGNKGVASWLAFTEQIGLCTKAMQQFISHSVAMARAKAA